MSRIGVARTAVPGGFGLGHHLPVGCSVEHFPVSVGRRDFSSMLDTAVGLIRTKGARNEAQDRHMAFDLAAALPGLLPNAIAWAEEHEADALRVGAALSVDEVALARSVGVKHPELVRVCVVADLPLPDDPELRGVALQAGLLEQDMVGLALGYAVFLRHGHDTPRNLSHECRHVFQCEAEGSIAAFLPVYLSQIAEFGYDNAPLEVDARNHERDAP